VVVVVSQSHYKMVNSNLLYTVLTRARKRAVIADSGGLVSRVTNVQAIQSLGRVRIGTSHRRASGGIWSTRRGGP
jgi:ATP-dependent exoDNAse (exonuclease V) alpha subunit